MKTGLKIAGCAEEQMRHAHEKIKVLLKFKLIIIIIAIVAVAAMFLYKDNAPVLKGGYQNDIATGGNLESEYLQNGSYETKKLTAKAENPIGKYTIYYPAELESAEKRYPMVLVVNGTGFKASMYEPQFKQLASWGFIVVGTQDKNTGTADTTSKTLDYMLAQNEDNSSSFYQKIDVNNIGITGFSQGGAAVLRAITMFPNSSCYKTAVPLSPVNEVTAAEVSGYPYDLTKVKCPIMILSGSEGDFENLIVLPIERLNAMYEKITSTKVMARRVGMDHDHMMYSAEGYVTAWFMWQLHGDETAAKAFAGDIPELLNNGLYQDQQISGTN